MANQLQDVYLPLFVLQIPQKTLARYKLGQKDWVELLALVTDLELSESSIGTTFITLETYCQVFSLAKNLFGQDKLLRYYVEDVTPPHLGPVGLAMATAPTVGEGLDIWLSHAYILAPMLTLQRHTTVADQYVDASLNTDLGAINNDYMEMALLLTCKLVRELSGGHAVGSVSFSHEASLPPGFYQERFGLQPLFSQAQSRISFRRSDLDQANDNHAHVAYHQAMNDVRLLARNAAGQTRLSHRVRQLLLEAASRGEIYDLEQVAERLHFSIRTLTRRLQDEGSNFRELLSDARIELAKQLLRQPGTLIKSASDRAGFADVSAFSRAFRRYAQLSPKEYQDQQSKQA